MSCLVVENEKPLTLLRNVQIKVIEFDCRPPFRIVNIEFESYCPKVDFIKVMVHMKAIQPKSKMLFRKIIEKEILTLITKLKSRHIYIVADHMIQP